jgi:hypothetical protein
MGFLPVVSRALGISTTRLSNSSFDIAWPIRHLFLLSTMSLIAASNSQLSAKTRQADLS